VQGERRGARVDQSRPELEACARAVRDPAPELHRHRQVDGLGDCAHQARGKIRVLEQRRPGSRAGDLLHGTAEVEVDDVRAGRLHHPRGLGHRARVAAEELDRERMLVRGDPQVPERALVPVLDPGAADHLRADEPGPVAASLPAKCLHADACHRREDEARRDLDVTDPPGVLKVDLHGVEC
jgi:hypothetical protein